MSKELKQQYSDAQKRLVNLQSALRDNERLMEISKSNHHILHNKSTEFHIRINAVSAEMEALGGKIKAEEAFNNAQSDTSEKVKAKERDIAKKQGVLDIAKEGPLKQAVAKNIIKQQGELAALKETLEEEQKWFNTVLQKAVGKETSICLSCITEILDRREAIYAMDYPKLRAARDQASDSMNKLNELIKRDKLLNIDAGNALIEPIDRLKSVEGFKSFKKEAKCETLKDFSELLEALAKGESGLNATKALIAQKIENRGEPNPYLMLVESLYDEVKGDLLQIYEATSELNEVQDASAVVDILENNREALITKDIVVKTPKGEQAKILSSKLLTPEMQGKNSYHDFFTAKFKDIAGLYCPDTWLIVYQYYGRPMITVMTKEISPQLATLCGTQYRVQDKVLKILAKAAPNPNEMEDIIFSYNDSLIDLTMLSQAKAEEAINSWSSTWKIVCRNPQFINLPKDVMTLFKVGGFTREGAGVLEIYLKRDCAKAIAALYKAEFVSYKAFQESLKPPAPALEPENDPMSLDYKPKERDLGESVAGARDVEQSPVLSREEQKSDKSAAAGGAAAVAGSGAEVQGGPLEISFGGDVVHYYSDNE